MQKILPKPQDWMRDALCQGKTGMFFVDNTTDDDAINRAKKVCSECPVRLECLRYAIKLREPNGIWGGHTPEERELMIRRIRYKRQAESRRRRREERKKEEAQSA